MPVGTSGQSSDTTWATIVPSPDSHQADSARDLAVAALRIHESEPDEAERLARRALGALPASGDAHAEATALQALGMIAWERQAIPDALDALRAAVATAEGAGDTVTAACARARLALVLSYAGDDAEALRVAESAAPALVGHQRAELHHHMAGILERVGRLHEALELSTRALRVFRRSGDLLWQAKARNNRGIILAHLGDVASAKQELDLAEQLYAQLAMPLGRLKIRNNQAWVAGLRGDVPAALGLHEGVQRELAAFGVPPGLFRLDHAAVLLAAALPAEALTVAEQAAAELATEGMLGDRADALLLGCSAARLAGSFDTADRLGHEAAAAFDEQQRTIWSLRARHAIIENAWAAGRHDPETEQMARAVADDLTVAGWLHWARAIHVLIGAMALARGDVDEATSRLRLAQVGTRPEPSRAAAIAALRARIHFARGDSANARRSVQRGLRRLEEHEAWLGATELRVRASQQVAELAELGLQWALSTGRASSILVWAERRRAATLRLDPVTPPRDRRLADLLAARRAAAFAADQIESSQDFQAGPSLSRSQRVAALDAKIRDFSRTVPGHGVAVPNTFISTSRLASELGTRALVELVGVGDELCAVAVKDRRFTFRPLAGLGEVQEELSYSQFALARSTVPSAHRAVDPLQASLERLDELIGEPMRRLVGDRELVVVPVASLHVLPWGSLPSLRDRPVSVAPSATTWLDASARAVRRRPRVVVVAGPGLEHADAEAHAVARTARAHRTLTGAAATADAVLRALDGATVAHLACHGRTAPTTRSSRRCSSPTVR